MQHLFVFFFGILGAIIGSFLNVVILRLPRGQGLGGRSHCPHCKHGLAPSDLVPVLSFVWLRGRCRYCGRRISPRYFYVECATALLFALLAQATGFGSSVQVLMLVKYALLTAALIAVFVIDLEHFLIMDRLVWSVSISLAVLNVGLDIAGQGPVFSLSSHFLGGIVAAAAGALPLFLVWLFSRGSWMGFGDVKLMVLLGVGLGVPQVFVALFLGFFLGGIISIVLLIGKKKKFGSRVPLGTFLAMGAYMSMLHGDKILQAYLALIGFSWYN